jgi:hypothetical protein
MNELSEAPGCSTCTARLRSREMILRGEQHDNVFGGRLSLTSSSNLAESIAMLLNLADYSCHYTWLEWRLRLGFWWIQLRNSKKLVDFYNVRFHCKEQLIQASYMGEQDNASHSCRWKLWNRVGSRWDLQILAAELSYQSVLISLLC